MQKAEEDNAIDCLMNEGGHRGSEDEADQDDDVAVVDSPMDVSDDTGADLDGTSVGDSDEE